jgi:hypothetical protein
MAWYCVRVRVKLGSSGLWTRELGTSEKDQRVDVLGNAVGDPGNHHPTVAVADQHRVLDSLGLQHICEALDVVEVDLGDKQMAPIANPGEGQRVSLVTVPPKPACERLEPPTAAPGTGN